MLELGTLLPTVDECIILRFIFDQSFGELWPKMQAAAQKKFSRSLLQLIAELEHEKNVVRTRRKAQINLICTNLRMMVDRLSKEDSRKEL